MEAFEMLDLNHDAPRYSSYTVWNNVTLINGPTIIVQNFLSSVPYYGVFGVLIPLLVTVLQVHVQGTTKSSFETHPINMWIFLVATIIYYSAFAADMKFTRNCTDNYSDQSTIYSQLFNVIGFISGSLSSVALIAILPDSGGYKIFIAWAFVPIVLVYKNGTSIKGAYDWLYQKINGMEQLQLPQLPRLPV